MHAFLIPILRIYKLLVLKAKYSKLIIIITYISSSHIRIDTFLFNIFKQKNIFPMEISLTVSENASGHCKTNVIHVITKSFVTAIIFSA